MKIKIVNGVTLTTIEDIGENVMLDFTELYQSTSQVTPVDSNLFADERSYISTLSLTQAPDEIEILSAFQSIFPNKAPSPYGFSSSFYVNCWDIIKKEVILTIQSFFLGDDLGKEKITLDNFHPISLTTVISKVLSKLIVNRLQPLFSKIISPHQSTFIKGREIADNILLAQEMIENMDKKCRGENMVFKLDIKEAFDTIS
ncbi:uncharacterized protein LOC110036018 [Phalaenopsis equestris]|uniref:uncharacterized protein LOC110036018 n=1 Tax=Phalaenopsis equestris TaxID=78828 RepID=UPI0009E27F7A|nr:uncharacterized protein LOC110036018 [Phalaenopsis equestris]